MHCVSNVYYDIQFLRNCLSLSGFGPQNRVALIDDRPNSSERIARYISGYATDRNALDPVRDKGVRRLIFIGPHTRVCNMRYRSSLRQVTSLGRCLSNDMSEAEFKAWNDFQRHIETDDTRKRVWETYGQWYCRCRGYWFRVGWESLSEAERCDLSALDDTVVKYLESGYWSWV